MSLIRHALRSCVVCKPRCLHTSTPVRAQNSLEDELQKAEHWLQAEGQQFRNIKPGTTNFITGRSNQPFPLNPSYTIRAPVSDNTRNTLYQLHKADPKTNTALELANKFQLSQARVEAILRLKELEAQRLSEGWALQKDFQRGMEEMLIVDGVETIRESVKVGTAIKEAPYLLVIQEGRRFGRQEAAKILGKKSDSEEGEQASTESVVDPFRIPMPGDHNPAADASLKIEEREPQVADNERKYIFTDISTKKPVITVRDQSGDLRSPTTYEKALRLRTLQLPNFKTLERERTEIPQRELEAKRATDLYRSDAENEERMKAKQERRLQAGKSGSAKWLTRGRVNKKR